MYAYLHCNYKWYVVLALGYNTLLQYYRIINNQYATRHLCNLDVFWCFLCRMIAIGGKLYKLKLEHFRPFSDFIWFFCLLHLSVLAFLLGSKRKKKNECQNIGATG